jgi:hypothetical protein
LFGELRTQYAAALFADKRHLLEPVAEWVAKLKNEYLTTEQQVKKLKESYRRAIEGITLSDQVDSIRMELRRTSERLTLIRRGVEERVGKLVNTLSPQSSL